MNQQNAGLHTAINRVLVMGGVIVEAGESFLHIFVFRLWSEIETCLFSVSLINRGEY